MLTFLERHNLLIALEVLPNFCDSILWVYDRIVEVRGRGAGDRP